MGTIRVWPGKDDGSERYASIFSGGRAYWKTNVLGYVRSAEANTTPGLDDKAIEDKVTALVKESA